MPHPRNGSLLSKSRWPLVATSSLQTENNTATANLRNAIFLFEKVSESIRRRVTYNRKIFIIRGTDIQKVNMSTITRRNCIFFFGISNVETFRILCKKFLLRDRPVRSLFKHFSIVAIQTWHVFIFGGVLKPPVEASCGPLYRIFIYLKLVFSLSTSRSCNPSFYGRRVQQSRVLFIYLFISVEKFRFFSTFCKNALFENFLIVPRVCGCAFRVRANDFESVFFSLYIRQHNAK